MVELGGFLPTLGVVTNSAFYSKLTRVRIVFGMAGLAIL